LSYTSTPHTSSWRGAWLSTRYIFMELNLCFHESGVFLNHLRDPQFLKKDSAPWRQVVYTLHNPNV